MSRKCAKSFSRAASLSPRSDHYKRTDFEFLPPGKDRRLRLKSGAPAVVGMEAMHANKIQISNLTSSPRSCSIRSSAIASRTISSAAQQP